MDSHAVVGGVVVVVVIVACTCMCSEVPGELDVPPRECLSSNVLLRSEVTFLYHF